MRYVDRSDSIIPPLVLPWNYRQISALFDRPHIVHIFIVFLVNNANHALLTTNVNDQCYSVLKRINSNIFCWGRLTHRVAVAAVGLKCI